jgi:membrane-associated phospholipid phosphatase
VTQVAAPIRPRPAEHPLLGMPKRDVITTAVLAVLTAVLFVLMAFSGTRAAIQRIDDRWLNLMVDARTPALTGVAKVFNVLGLVVVIWPVRAVVVLFLAVKRRWWHLAAFVLAVFLSELAIGSLKTLYDRPRPPDPLVHVSGGSFPSGHSLAASATMIAIVIALFPEGPRRYWWGAGAVAFAVLMGLSRTYLAAHWLSDSVAGILMGTTLALGAAIIVHVIRERRAARSDGVRRGGFEPPTRGLEGREGAPL